MFKIEVSGNLGADAQVKSDGGRTYVQFSVADTKRYKKEDGTEVEQTNWVSCFMRNPGSPVIPYLKKGTRVWVRGNGELRLFSSAKDRMMKAGASVNVSEIELMGGSSDDVPRELVLPTGQICEVTKHYWLHADPKPEYVFDKRGNRYEVDPSGFVIVPEKPQPEQAQEQAQQTEAQPAQAQQTEAQPAQAAAEPCPTGDAPFTGDDKPEQIAVSSKKTKK